LALLPGGPSSNTVLSDFLKKNKGKSAANAADFFIALRKQLQNLRKFGIMYRNIYWRNSNGG